MAFDKTKIIMKTFITSQFSYYLLVWIFHSKRLSKKINALHEEALRNTCGDKMSTLNEMLEKDNSVSIHHKNVQALATEISKISNNISPTTLSNILTPRATP